jgi:glycosyltransferase involved in cell wall biosynthesis
MMVTFQWDYAAQTRQNEQRGPKFWLAPMLERLAIAPADLVLVTAEWLRDVVGQRYGKPTVLLPNWVDVDDAASSERSRSDHGPIVYAGRLHPSKGIDVLIRAFAQVSGRHPRVKLLLCGDGEARAALRKLVKSLGCTNVEFRGVVENHEVVSLLRDASLFVLPTTTMEGHPKALAEAMAVGTPCIASDIPGNRQMISDGVTGLLVKPNDVASLAEALSRLLADGNLRMALGAAAAESARAFSFERVVSEEIRVLRRLSEGVS